MSDQCNQCETSTFSVFTRFCKRHYPIVLRVARKRLLSEADAQDAAAETFCIAWAHYLNGGELSMQWVYRVLRNVIGNEYQRVARSDRLIERIGCADEVVSDGRSDRTLDMQRCLNCLPEEEREIIRMFYWEDLSGSEIAKRLHISPENVRVRLSRARKSMRLLIEKASETLIERGCEETSPPNDHTGRPGDES